MWCRSFGSNLCAARKDLGLTQGELSKATGINDTQISHYESGTREPSLSNARSLSLALKVSLDRLCGIRWENEYDNGFRDGLRASVGVLSSELDRYAKMDKAS